MIIANVDKEPFCFSKLTYKGENKGEDYSMEPLELAALSQAIVQRIGSKHY